VPSARQIISEIVEQQVSDLARLKRIVAAFQRALGTTFGNASVNRRNRRYEIDVAVYEQPSTVAGKPIQMDRKTILNRIMLTARQVHPGLVRSMRVDVKPWQTGHSSHKLFCPVRIYIAIDQRE
jgi:hypothetical protein